MTKSELRETLTALGMTQARLSRALGVDGRTVRRWTSGELPVPVTVALLLHVWKRYPELIPQDGK